MVKKYISKYNREKNGQQLWYYIAQEYNKKDKIVYSRLKNKLRLERTLRNGSRLTHITWKAELLKKS